MIKRRRPIKDMAFAVISVNIILPFTIRSTRKQCISEYERENNQSWEEAKMGGKTCEKVTISTIK